MKKSISLFILLIYSLALVAQTDYYWYKDRKIPLWKDTSQKFILFEDLPDTNGPDKILKQTGVRIIKQTITNISGNVIPYGNKEIKKLNWAVVSDTVQKIAFTNNTQVKYESCFYKTSGGADAGLSNLFYVKLERKEDINILDRFAKENKVEILGNNKYMPLWYTLSCSKYSKGNALEMADRFYESEQFAAAEPDLMTDIQPLCSNDPLFDSQWGLENTGQNGGTPGMDIHYCQARQITSGDQNIVIAVVDDGVEINHPDFSNIYYLSYTDPDLTNTGNWAAHGTCCAGIIGATTNNNLGVSGIAPDCPLMVVRIDMSGNADARQRRADAINFAWQNGASVISSSWCWDPSLGGFQLIDDAIENALINGRNGLGCVVVFATGNENTNVYYPANSNPDILAVGGTDICGRRANYDSSCSYPGYPGSNYGPELDIMAPGMDNPTTDMQGSWGYDTSSGIAGNYTLFGGTSSACPQVAAIAGLLLSEHPNITQEEVSSVIESTARKVGGYSYTTTSGRPNGTWNIEMGYGLVDAYAVLEAEVCESALVTNTTYTSNTTIQDCYAVLKNVMVQNNAKLTISSHKGAKIIGPFEVKAGSQLEISPNP